MVNSAHIIASLSCTCPTSVRPLRPAEQQRYDHHQRGFTEVFGHGFSPQLSSAGLVYKHFGRDIVAEAAGVAPDHENAQLLWLTVYKFFIEALDAIDNGEPCAAADNLAHALL